MNFQPYAEELKGTTSKDISDFIIDFFKYQYHKSIEYETNRRAYFNSSITANETALKEYANNNDDIMSFGPKLPFNDNALKALHSEMEHAKKLREEASIIFRYCINKFIETGV